MRVVNSSFWSHPKRSRIRQAPRTSTRVYPPVYTSPNGSNCPDSTCTWVNRESCGSGSPGGADVPAVLRPPRGAPARLQVLAVRVGVVGRDHQVRQHVHLGGDLHALAARAAHVEGPPEGGGR